MEKQWRELDSLDADCMKIALDESLHSRHGIGVGAVVRHMNGTISRGVNSAHRSLDIEKVSSVHAEILAMVRFGANNLIGSTMYITHPPCHRCCVAMATFGIYGVAFLDFPADSAFRDRWEKNHKKGIKALDKCGVKWVRVTGYGNLD